MRVAEGGGGLQSLLGYPGQCNALRSMIRTVQLADWPYNGAVAWRKASGYAACLWRLAIWRRA